MEQKRYFYAPEPLNLCIAILLFSSALNGSHRRRLANEGFWNHFLHSSFSLTTLVVRSDDDCCNSCDEVREAYRKRGWAMTNTDMIDQCKREGFVQKVKEEDCEGCNLVGSLEVNKVAGNFHFTPGKSFHLSNFLIPDLLGFSKDSYNISHKISKLSFGEYFPGAVNPLDGVHWEHESPYGTYQYFIKVVPTIYTDIRGRTVHSYQFSVTEHFRFRPLGYSSRSILYL